MSNDQAMRVVQKVIDNLTDRRGFDAMWDECDSEVRCEILKSIAEIVAATAPICAPAKNLMVGEVIDPYVMNLVRQYGHEMTNTEIVEKFLPKEKIAATPQPAGEGRGLQTAFGEILAFELEGVIADVEHGNGFDMVCLRTVKRVRDALRAASVVDIASRSEAPRLPVHGAVTPDSWERVCVALGEHCDTDIERIIEGIEHLRAQCREPVVSSANGWRHKIQTWYIHQGCGGHWQVHYNDTGFYALCPKCDEHRSIDPRFPPIVYATKNAAQQASDSSVQTPARETGEPPAGAAPTPATPAVAPPIGVVERLELPAFIRPNAKLNAALDAKTDAQHLANLVLFINKICYHLSLHNGNVHLWAGRASSYIRTNGLSSPLREAATLETNLRGGE